MWYKSDIRLTDQKEKGALGLNVLILNYSSLDLLLYEKKYNEVSGG